MAEQRHLYYNREGEPVDWEQWAALTNAPERSVACNQIGNDVIVSTAWFGVDLECGVGEGPPLIFETRIFGGPLDRECERYSSEERAREGHVRMVARAAARSALAQEVIAELRSTSDGGP